VCYRLQTMKDNTEMAEATQTASLHRDTYGPSDALLAATKGFKEPVGSDAVLPEGEAPASPVSDAAAL